MSWELILDPAAAERRAGGFLRGDPVRHTVALGALRQAVTDGQPSLWAVLVEGGAVTGVAWRTPPFGLGITGVDPRRAAELARRMGGMNPDDVHLTALPAVVGPPDPVRALAAGLAPRLRLEVSREMSETLYELRGRDRLHQPPSTAGRPGMPDTEHIPQLEAWMDAFVTEARRPPADSGARVRQAMESDTLWIWSRDGDPVGMVGARVTGEGVARIGPVFTPPAERGRGIAAALTAHVAGSLFDAGTGTVTLFADDANPTSTGVYRRLGFTPVGSWLELQLRRETSGPTG